MFIPETLVFHIYFSFIFCMCICVGVYACECRGQWRPEVSALPGAGLVGGFPINMGAGNLTECIP